MDAAPLYTELTRCLEQRSIPDAAFDVRCMFEQVTGSPYERLLITGLSPEDEEPLRNMAQRRACGEPLQYILGEWEFYGMRLFVGKGVLIPRPDTETLVDTVLTWCRGMQHIKILDLCTGSGCIALALQKQLPDAEIHAVDLSEDALKFARKNKTFHRLPVELHAGDVTDSRTAAAFGDFDVIVSNPPYLDRNDMEQLQPEVRHEPEMALAAGEDGLCFYQRITEVWKSVLKTGGLLAYEIGETQGQAVSAILRAHGFKDVQVMQDLARNDRVVLGITTNQES